MEIKAKVLEIQQDAVAMIGRVLAHKIYRNLIKGFQTKPIKHLVYGVSSLSSGLKDFTNSHV